MADEIAGVKIPDSRLARDATELIRDTTNELIFHHSRRVYLFGSLQARALDLRPDDELLYVAALFHDTGLVPPYRGTSQRFEMDSADAAREFLASHDVTGEPADVVWTAIALHTTPEVPYRLNPVIAATTAGWRPMCWVCASTSSAPKRGRPSPRRIRGRTSRTASCRRSPRASRTARRRRSAP